MEMTNNPDLSPLVIGRDWVERVRSEMVELPWVMAARFCSDYVLPEYDAATLTQSMAMAAYFEATAKACGQPKLASNWIMGEVSRRLNSGELAFEQLPVPFKLAIYGSHIKGVRNEFTGGVLDATDLYNDGQWPTSHCSQVEWPEHLRRHELSKVDQMNLHPVSAHDLPPHFVRLLILHFRNDELDGYLLLPVDDLERGSSDTQCMERLTGDQLVL